MRSNTPEGANGRTVSRGVRDGTGRVGLVGCLVLGTDGVDGATGPVLAGLLAASTRW